MLPLIQWKLPIGYFYTTVLKLVARLAIEQTWGYSGSLDTHNREKAKELHCSEQIWGTSDGRVFYIGCSGKKRTKFSAP